MRIRIEEREILGGMRVEGKTVRLFSLIAKILSPPPELTVSGWADRDL